MMLLNGFMEPIPDDEVTGSSGRCWYLTHHHVYHKQKGTIRIVFNCSLKFNGKSLNDYLSKGPDIANNLFGVLLRFRQYKIAVIGDIEKMFYRVKVPHDHSNFLRLFWLNESGEVSQYRLTVHVFGATSSPSVANYVLKQMVTQTEDEKIKSAIDRNFYVDDFLGSFDNEQSAIEVTGGVRDTVQKGSFNPRGFKSNSRSVLEKLAPQELEESSKRVPIYQNGNDKALGVSWNTESDELSYDVSIPINTQITKKVLLSHLASVFDPLGLCSPVLLKGKRIFQEACRLTSSWDEVLPRHLVEIWEDWVADVNTLVNYSIPRCLSKGGTVS